MIDPSTREAIECERTFRELRALLMLRGIQERRANTVARVLAYDARLDDLTDPELDIVRDSFRSILRRAL